MGHVNEQTRVRTPWTLYLGVTIITLAELLLAIDVVRRDGLVAPYDGPIPAPRDALECVTRWVSINMTVLCWIGYLFVFDALLTRLARKRGDRSISSLRARPNRYVVAWLTSIPLWCFFDWINFAYLRAWTYHGLPELFSQRVMGYFLAFAAISPGMFMAAQLYQHMGMKNWRTAAVRIPMSAQIACVVLGVLFMIYPFLVREPIGSLTLWVSVMFLLDPVNHWLGAPSIIGDWRAGRWGRTLALMGGGATCGLLWEFWNYWALTKWTYDLPFLGSWEQYRYFEMPWLGFLGFLPFAIECWVVLNTILALLERVSIVQAEPLSSDLDVL